MPYLFDVAEMSRQLTTQLEIHIPVIRPIFHQNRGHVDVYTSEQKLVIIVSNKLWEGGVLETGW